MRPIYFNFLAKLLEVEAHEPVWDFLKVLNKKALPSTSRRKLIKVCLAAVLDRDFNSLITTKVKSLPELGLNDSCLPLCYRRIYDGVVIIFSGGIGAESKVCCKFGNVENLP